MFRRNICSFYGIIAEGSGEDAVPAFWRPSLPDNIAGCAYYSAALRSSMGWHYGAGSRSSCINRIKIIKHTIGKKHCTGFPMQ